MDIKIKKLTKGMGNAFADYFDNLDFSHEPHYAGCYCRFYHMDNSIEDWTGRTGEQNRADAIEAIDKGNMTGFLAYSGDECIGWLNADDWQNYGRLEGYISKYVDRKKAAVLICYVIHPQYRSMGVAKALLNHAVEYFKENGYDGVMALPIESNTFSQKLYRGTVSMYEKAGFVKIDEFEYGQVFWLKLK